MRFSLALTTLAVLTLPLAACGTDDRPTGVEPTTSAAPQSMSLAEFCGDYGEEVLQPLADEFAAAADTFAQTLPELGPSDEDEINALIDDMEAPADELSAALQDAADMLDEPEVAPDIADAAETIGAFPDAVRDGIFSGELDENQATAVQETFAALDGHCE